MYMYLLTLNIYMLCKTTLFDIPPWYDFSCGWGSSSHRRICDRPCSGCSMSRTWSLDLLSVFSTLFLRITSSSVYFARNTRARRILVRHCRSALFLAHGNIVSDSTRGRSVPFRRGTSSLRRTPHRRPLVIFRDWNIFSSCNRLRPIFEAIVRRTSRLRMAPPLLAESSASNTLTPLSGKCSMLALLIRSNSILYISYFTAKYIFISFLLSVIYSSSHTTKNTTWLR